MNDQVLPSNNNSTPQSYVDSYQPPAGITQPPSQPVASPAPATKSNPLAELEKLLKEYENKGENARHSSKPVAKPAAPKPVALKPTHKPKRDPLAELEEALKRYESKSKHNKTKVKAKAVPKPPPPKPKPVVTKSSPKPAKPKKDPLAELEKLLAEYDKKSSPKPTHKPKVDKKPQPKFERVNVAPEPALKKFIPVAKPNQASSPAPDSAPALTPTPAPTPPATQEKQAGQSIEEQNIFELLGVADSTDQEKEAFLNELQEAIWEDFLDKDLGLLVGTNEIGKIQELRNQLAQNSQDAKLQEKLVDEVEKLVPDIEEILLEKALELKEDMVWERVAGMKEYYQGRDEAIQKLQEAEGHFKKGHWQMGTSILNTLVP